MGALSAFGLGAGSALGNYAANETPAGVINGVNKAYTLANPPVPAATLQLFLNGVLQRPAGVDFTLVGLTCTMVNAPVVGDVLTAYYFY